MADTGVEERVNGMHPSFLNVIRQRERVRERLKGVKNKIGVYSAKGGVGKTSISINIAYTLMRMGFKVGLLDADIDCPNITTFLNISDKMDLSGFPLKPLDRGGVRIASTAMIVDDDKRPIIWRGPMIAKMLGDFFENTEWGELDYLVIDLPPGTSDSPLSILQLVEMRGFILVTTPSRVSVADSMRSGLMVKRFGAAILGVVENMSDSDKPSRATVELAGELGTQVLGCVRRDEIFREMDSTGDVPVLRSESLYGEFRKILSGMTGR